LSRDYGGLFGNDDCWLLLCDDNAWRENDGGLLEDNARTSQCVGNVELALRGMNVVAISGMQLAPLLSNRMHFHVSQWNLNFSQEIVRHHVSGAVDLETENVTENITRVQVELFIPNRRMCRVFCGGVKVFCVAKDATFNERFRVPQKSNSWKRSCLDDPQMEVWPHRFVNYDNSSVVVMVTKHSSKGFLILILLCHCDVSR